MSAKSIRGEGYFVVYNKKGEACVITPAHPAYEKLRSMTDEELDNVKLDSQWWYNIINAMNKLTENRDG